MEQELIHGLETLAPEDRDFKSLLVWVNPSYINGSDLEAGVSLRKNLRKLLAKNIIKEEISPQKRTIYTLT